MISTDMKTEDYMSYVGTYKLMQNPLFFQLEERKNLTRFPTTKIVQAVIREEYPYEDIYKITATFYTVDDLKRDIEKHQDVDELYVIVSSDGRIESWGSPTEMNSTVNKLGVNSVGYRLEYFSEYS